MTTTVKVTAHCGKEKQVRIIRSNLATQEGSQVVIQDGDTSEQYLHDDWKIAVKEELKEPAP
jgi:hypothetical protein